MELWHHGVRGQKWGVRRYTNKDGSLNAEGYDKYVKNDKKFKNYRQERSYLNNRLYKDNIKTGKDYGKYLKKTKSKFSVSQKNIVFDNSVAARKAIDKYISNKYNIPISELNKHSDMNMGLGIKYMNLWDNKLRQY